MHRMTLRTGARDTKSVRTISLMERSCSKSARRISPILSTPIIPISPSQPTEAKGKDADTQRQRGSLLDAKIAPQGVIIASEFTAQQAVVKVEELLFRGHPEVVDADLADYFGSIPHAGLLQSV